MIKRKMIKMNKVEIIMTNNLEVLTLFQMNFRLSDTLILEEIIILRIKVKSNQRILINLMLLRLLLILLLESLMSVKFRIKVMLENSNKTKE